MPFFGWESCGHIAAPFSGGGLRDGIFTARPAELRPDPDDGKIGGRTLLPGFC